MEEEQTCQETDLEPVVYKTEKANRVVCNIQKAQAAGADLNASNAAVDHLQDGVKLGAFSLLLCSVVNIVLPECYFERKLFPVEYLMTRG